MSTVGVGRDRHPSDILRLTFKSTFRYGHRQMVLQANSMIPAEEGCGAAHYPSCEDQALLSLELLSTWPSVNRPRLII